LPGPELDDLGAVTQSADRRGGRKSSALYVAARPQGTTGVLTLRSDWDSCV
jgi:hypothetical protein